MSRISEIRTARQRIKTTVAWFIHFSTLGGFCQIRDSNNRISKFFWTLLFLAGAGITVVGVMQCWDDYFMYKTLSTSKVVTHTKREFPAVTICNANRINCRNLYQLITEAKEARICSSTVVVHLQYTWLFKASIA